MVACALALFFREPFVSEAKAKDAFKVGPSTDVRGRWVKSKLVALEKVNPGSTRKQSRVQQSPSVETIQTPQLRHRPPQSLQFLRQLILRTMMPSMHR